MQYGERPYTAARVEAVIINRMLLLSEKNKNRKRVFANSNNYTLKSANVNRDDKIIIYTCVSYSRLNFNIDAILSDYYKFEWNGYISFRQALFADRA